MPVVPRMLLAGVLLVASFGAARGACPAPAAAAFGAGSSPQAVVAADFNGDGVPDLGVACLSGAPLAVLLGTSTGGYGAPVAYAGGTAGRALVAADFDADGRIDLAVAVSDGVRIWRGSGDGTFVAGAVLTCGSANRGIACADFDGDGIVDLALASSSTNSVLVLRGLGSAGAGNGGFGAPASYAVGASPARIVAADLDGDGITDLAVANNGGASVSILRGRGSDGRGDGTFAPAFALALPGSPWGLAVVDWNRDGAPDLVVSDGAGTTLTLLRAGGGTFTSAGTVTTPTAPRDLATGDFDGDGIVDVAAACAAGNVASVLHGTGAGFTLLGNWAAGSGATGIAATDANRDGAPDLVVANAGGGSVTRWLATCPPSPAAAVTLLEPLGGEAWWPGTVPRVRWASAGGIAAVDVDLSFDGGASWRALARGCAGTSVPGPTSGVPGAHLRVRVRDALVPARAAASPADFTLCGLLDSARVSDAGLVATHLASGDVDGDGRADLLACDDTRIEVLRGGGDGRFTVGASFAAGPTRRLRLADVDGDGIDDLVRLAPDAVVTYRGDGAGGFGAPVARPLAGGTDLVAVDFDGDGVADLAAVAPEGAAGRLFVWRSSVPGAPWTLPLPGVPVALVACDFDRDGITDLALGTQTGLSLLTGNGAGGRGDGTFWAGPERRVATPPGDLAAQDLDGDGSPELIACVPASGDLWRVAVSPPASASAGSLAAPQASAAGGAAVTPLVTDLDGDGRADVVVAIAGHAAIAVLRGMPGGFAPPVRFADGLVSGEIVMDDFTGDGNPDVVAAGPDGRVRCLPAQCSPRMPAWVALAAPADTTAALAGFVRRVSWTHAGSVPAARLELSRDDGAHWTTVGDAFGGSELAWIASGPATDRARLRVRDACCGTRFDEGRRFAIREPLDAARFSAVPAGASELSLADVDGAPVAAIAGAAGVTIARGDGAGGWSAGATFAEPGIVRARLVDADADGATDLLALHADSLFVRHGDGLGGFGSVEVMRVEPGARDIAIGDFDDDGVPDLGVAFTNPYGNGLALYSGASLGDDPGAFGPARIIPLPAPPRAIAAVDLDGDGILDLLVAHEAGLRALLGNGAAGRGDGTFRAVSERAFATAARALLVADLDGDGVPDAAAADGASATLRIAAGDGHGAFGAPVSITLPAPALALAACDMDHDGATDLAIALGDAGLLVLRGTPGAPLARRFAPAWSVTGPARSLALIDADGDGAADAVTLDPAGALTTRLGRAAPMAVPVLAGPAEGTSTAFGEERSLSWSRSPGLPALDVQLSRDGGARWVTIASALSATRWAWTVSGPATAAARLRLRDPAVPERPGPAGPTFAIGSAVAGAPFPAAIATRFERRSRNPAFGSATFALQLAVAGAVRVEVRDVAGRAVRTLADGTLGAGRHALHWDGADARGTPAPAGLYFVRAHAPGLDVTHRIALAR